MTLGHHHRHRHGVHQQPVRNILEKFKQKGRGKAVCLETTYVGKGAFQEGSISPEKTYSVV